MSSSMSSSDARIAKILSSEGSLFCPLTPTFLPLHAPRQNLPSIPATTVLPHCARRLFKTDPAHYKVPIGTLVQITGLKHESGRAKSTYSFKGKYAKVVRFGAQSCGGWYVLQLLETGKFESFRRGAFQVITLPTDASSSSSSSVPMDIQFPSLSHSTSSFDFSSCSSINESKQAASTLSLPPISPISILSPIPLIRWKSDPNRPRKMRAKTAIAAARQQEQKQEQEQEQEDAIEPIEGSHLFGKHFSCRRFHDTT